MTRDRDDVADEAAHARSLAARLRTLDFAETQPPRGLRELERALEAFAAALQAAGGKPGEGETRAARASAWSAIEDFVAAAGGALESVQRAHAVERMRLAEGLRLAEREIQARDAAKAESERLASHVSSLEGSLDDARAELRARDASIAALTAEQARLASEDARLESERVRLEAERARLEAEAARLAAELARQNAILSQPGHRLVTRLGTILASYPRIGSAASAVVRGLNRLLGRR